MIPFAPPYIDEDVIQEVTEVLRSGWITTGPKVVELEQKIGEVSGVEHVVCVNSATSGLMLMLHWFGVGKGDEVIVPAYTYCATALAVLHCGAIPVMVDVEEDFNISVRKIEQAITKNTKVIIPVDIAGWPCDYEKINSLVNQPKIKALFNASSSVQSDLGRILVISDAAHSFGAEYHGNKNGGLTDLTVFSFHAVKNITTAEGGAICLNLPKPFDNHKIYKELKVLSLNGQTKDALQKSISGEWRYDIISKGMKINMPDICAAIGLAQLRKYDGQLYVKRKEIFKTYAKAFGQYSWAILPPFEDNRSISSCHVFLLRINHISEKQRDAMIKHITSNDVSVNVHFIPMPMLTVFAEDGYNIKDYPQSYANYASEISLPVYPQLTENNLKTIINSVVAAYQSVVC